MVKTKLEKLNLLDRFLFDEAMEDRETYQAVVSILLENEVEILEKPQTEKEIRISPELRAARRSGYGCTEKNLLYGNAKEGYEKSDQEKPLLPGAFG